MPRVRGVEDGGRERRDDTDTGAANGSGARHDGARVAAGKPRAKGTTFLALCALAFATLVVIWQVPYRFTINVGDRSDTRYVRGVYDPEGKGDFTYRWTEDLALIRLPQGVFPGEADVVLSGNRPGAKPPQVAFGFEGDATPLTRAQSTTDFAVYPVRLPTNGNLANPALTPELTLAVSDTVTPPKENRALGVAVERVVVYTNPLRFGPVVPPPLMLLLVLGMMAALALLALSVAPSVGPLVAITYGPVLVTIAYLALQRAADPGELAHGVIGFTAAAAVRRSSSGRACCVDARGCGAGGARWSLARRCRSARRARLRTLCLVPDVRPPLRRHAYHATICAELRGRVRAPL